MTILLSVLLGLISMIAYGASNAFAKPLSQKLGAPQLIFLRGLSMVVILGFASIPTYCYLSHWTVAIAAVGLGLVGYLPALAFTHGIKESPLGIMSPIAGTSPLVMIILSFLFLGLVLHPGQWLAVVVIVGANITMSVDVRNWRQSNFLKLSSGIPFAFMAAFGWGLFYFFLVPIARIINPWLAALFVEVGVTTAAGLHILFTTRKFLLKQSLQPRVVSNAALLCLGTIAFTVGAKYFNVGIVAVLSGSTALVSTLLGAYMFREKLRVKDRIAALILILSVAALSVF